ncbi:MAG: osmoprotectant transport system permease protein [Actinomycetota bacterium]|nr:osmoprotectant transport system permease protein [Actinomycetota bacterium]
MLVVAAAGDPWVRWDWVGRHLDDIAAATRQHVTLTLIAVGLGLALSFPLALLARRWHWLRSPILSLTGILYTIPSLALFAMLVPVTGLSRTTSEIGLVGYTLLILVRNILVGLDGVPDDVRESAQGMGFGPGRQLLRIELPLAAPVIFAGVRIATVTTIGLVTVTALIGQGGLGQLILDGLIRDFRTPLVVGSVLSVALAVVADGFLAGVQRLLTPWARRKSA